MSNILSAYGMPVCVKIPYFFQESIVSLRIFFLALVAVLPSALATAADGPPNIVLLLGDDQRWTDFGFMGHPAIQTPHLDKLASESAVFINGYVPTSLCRPSLATLITGQYAHVHKITGNDPPKGVDRKKMLPFIRQAPTLPRILGEHGYVSFQTGKWWEGNYSEGGFTAGMTHGDPARRGRHGDKGLAIGRKGLAPIWEFLDHNGDKPFFLWYAPMMPHNPHNPPKRLVEHYQAPGRPLALARYYAMCEWFDETCGELLAGLEERGLSENTLVIHLTDNGWIQRTPKTDVPKGWKKSYAPKSKRSPYDGGLRTPITLHWPGHIEPARYETLVSSIDVAPTILAAAGIEPPKSMTGLNLLQIIANGGKSPRKSVFGEVYTHDLAGIDTPVAGLRYRWIRQGPWKLIVPTATSEMPELYHVVKDPDETNNLADEAPGRVTRLRADLDRWWTPE